MHWDTVFSQRQPCFCIMLQATIKLCCGIAHDHLRRLPGLKTTVVAAIQKDRNGLVVKGSHHLSSKISPYIQRLMGKETAACPEHARDTNPSQLPGADLSYVTQGEAALQQALSILQQHTSWQAEMMLDNGATMSSTALPRLGKVFRAEVVLPVPVAWLHQELFERIEQMPQWNPTLSQVKVLQRIGTDTMVTHEVTAPSPGNLVGQRDFISVRHRRRKETAIYLVGTATHIEKLPLQEGCIRAESQLSCIVLQPLAGDPSHTRFTWLLSMDLKASATILLGMTKFRVFSLPKGWIPKSVINCVLPQSQADFIKHLGRHLSTAACP
ncbi:PREDICTED: steroidogenic acute regulatory protein, mitochondrial-like [Nestor notabilis]|uniref:steroidogenic acute regulatory protein, mitochondrial-like n=1 Tax=Nestor notabilis TaxID=176057 RepID=UPI0005235529|nr:PREDICTED: steroidogenic acute regulatory protein, mitochondrial-like [Nestor notabilis]